MFSNLKISSQCAEAIKQGIHSGRLSHALILEGSNAETRLLAAKEIAKALVCVGDTKPCGACRPCKKAESGNHPDIFLTEKGSSSMIKVDTIRELKEKAMLLPNDGEKSVFIISEAQYMNVQAQNALLKILEEPSPHVCFILTCETKSAFLDTIISRATAYYLSNEEYGAQGEANFEEAKKCAENLLTVLCRGNELDFLKKTAPFQKDKALFKTALSMLIPLLRDSLVVDSKVNLIADNRELALLLRQSFTPQKLMQFKDTAEELLSGIDRNANHNLQITGLCSAFYSIKTN